MGWRTTRSSPRSNTWAKGPKSGGTPGPLRKEEGALCADEVLTPVDLEVGHTSSRPQSTPATGGNPSFRVHSASIEVS